MGVTLVISNLATEDRMGFIAAIISIAVMAMMGNEVYKMWKKDRARVRMQKAIEEEAKREKQQRMKSWAGEKGFWD